MPHWVVAQVAPYRDQLAELSLKLAGFPVYGPRLRELRRVRGRTAIRTPLLFPSYLFVSIEQHWHVVKWAAGVRRLIMDGIVPACVPDRVISELRSREDGAGLIELPKFHPGDHVRIAHGPLTGLTGLYEGMRPHERVAVLLTLLGRVQRVELAADAVEVV